MQPEKAKPTASFPMWAFTAALCFTIAVFIGLGAHTWNSYQATKALQGRDLRILHLCGIVTHLDEVLTMSARMAATTGKPRWEERYRDFEPQLAKDIEDLTKLAPELREYEGAAQTDAANQRLVEMEYSAFDLIRDGKRDEAEVLLFSEEYETQKRIYADGMKKALTSVRSRTIEALRSQGRRTAWAVGGVISALAVLIPAWLGAFGIMRRHLAERKRAEQELRKAHDELEIRVQQRTADLRATNESLQCEITERRQAEQRLRESEERYRTLFEQAPDSVVVVNSEDGTLVEFNDKAYENLGFSRDEFEKLAIRDLEVAESAEEVTAHIKKILENGGDVFETKHRAKSGEIRDVLVNCRVITARGKTIFQSIWSDITERKRAETALRENEEKYRTLLENLPQKIFYKNTESVYVSCNANYAEDLGITPEEIVGKTDFEFYPKELAEKYRADDRRVIDSGRAEEIEERYVQRGEQRRIQTVKTPIEDDSGKVVGILGIFWDITERKQAEEALRRSEHALAKAEEIAHLGSWELDLCTHKETWSDETYRLLGLDPQQTKTTRDTFLSWVHADDRESVLLAIGDALAGKKQYDTEFRIIRSDEKERVLRSQGEVIRDESGRPVRMVGVAQDITERKQAEEALRDSSTALTKMVEEQNVLLEHTRDFVYRHDTNGVFNYLSPAVEQVTGYSVEEWWKHYTTYMTDSPINEKVIEYTEETLRTGKERPPYLVEIAHKDGHPVMLEVGERPYFEEGKVAGIVGVARDITERHRAEVALRESEQRLEAILDNSTAVIYMKDLTGRYIVVNRRFEEISKGLRQRIIGRTDRDVFPQEVADVLCANDERVLRVGVPMEFEEALPEEGGIHTFISLKFPLCDANGRPYAVCGISTDITERKRAAEELEKAKEAAEAANRAKSVFLANVSHEIRTPLTAMLGAAELLATDSADPERHSHRSDMIIRNGRHLLTLIDDLLDLSQAEAGKLEVECVPAALSEIIADIQAVTEPLHRQSAVDFRFRYETPVPTLILTDPTRLKQAVINLVSNALKFTETGYVWVRIAANRDGPEPRLSIAVEDTGVGISAADTERIFETFTRIAQVSTDLPEGLGLGLPLARYIAGQLGGSIEVSAKEHRGSTFTLRVATGPLDDTIWITPEEISITPKPLSLLGTAWEDQRLDGNVLLADDFPDTRELIEEVLRDRGATVTAVDNGEAAVDAALAQPFDLILMDMRMPRMDGLAATAELRRRGCLTPIIALTASATECERQRILDAGCDDLWAKPMTLGHLVSEVASYLRTSPDGGGPDRDDRCAVTVDNARLAAARAEFIQNLPERLMAIQASVQSRDIGRAREALHQLVGIGGIHGLMPVSHEAARLLRLAKSGTLADHPDELQPLSELVRCAVESLTGQDTAAPGPTAPAS